MQTLHHKVRRKTDLFCFKAIGGDRGPLALYPQWGRFWTAGVCGAWDGGWIIGDVAGLSLSDSLLYLSTLCLIWGGVSQIDVHLWLPEGSLI